MPTKRFGTYKRKNYDDIKKRNQEQHDRRIREKTIDEFAERLHELCGVEIGDYQYTDLLHESRIDEIAEQLKAGVK